LLLIASAAPLLAQGVTGTVTGSVRDPQGGVIPGATVTLISEARGTRSAPVVTDGTGGFVFPNVTADSYTIQVEMASFRTLRREGVAVSPGSVMAVGALTIQVGGTSEVVTVSSEAPLIQAASGERSYAIDTDSVNNLPVLRRTYDGLLALAPGVQTSTGLTFASRIGGGGGSNFMLDGATAMDPGVNRAAVRVSVEAISEVKVATSGYQAEYGRSSGLQINAVTKSGSNRFHGSLYDVERKSNWNANSKTNILNGDPKDFNEERDWGFALGGPVGRPGGDNKLFFFFNLEFNPRTVGNEVNTYRMPTALERTGDFSQSTDNNGNLYPYIKDPLRSGSCNASSQAACFADGGVLGRIPANRLYGPGMAILNWWPLPNIPNVPAGQNYNWSSTYPALDLLGYQPLVRLDYQPTTALRATFKYVEYQQPSKVHPGTIPNFNESKEDNYGIWVPSATVNWTITPTMFFEASYGGNFHHQEGCSVTGGSPNFCRNALPVNPVANRVVAGMGDIAYLFPDATVLDRNTFSYDVVSRSGSSVWDGERVQGVPAFSWGNRVTNAPPNLIGPFGNFILDTRTRNLNFTLTKVEGRHTLKTGYYYWHSLQRRGQGPILGQISFANDNNNPLDTTFGFANAAVGVFSSYRQVSRWGEGAYTAINHEFFLQDNWKVRSNVTLDYGVRFIRQTPEFDGYRKNSNFLPEEWKSDLAPALYQWGCANGVNPCSGNNRQAMNPLTGQFLGARTNAAVGTLVPDSGNSTNGIFAAGQGITDTAFTYPALAVAPRVGVAWDVSGTQDFVVRGGAGMFYDRPSANNVYNTVNNPPFSRDITVRYGQLQNLESSGLRTEAPPALTIFEYDMPLPASVQWNAGFQAALPLNAAIDVAYTGQHSYDEILNVNLNNIDLGTAFRPELQDPTLAVSTTPGQSSLVASNVNAVRSYQGYGTITQRTSEGRRTYHSVQLSLNRRFQNGLLFGFTDTIGLSDKQRSPLRLQHNPDGTVTIRADQAEADALLGNNHPIAHFMRAHFVWDLPDLSGSSGAVRGLAHLVNDWSLSGIWSGQTGSAYAVGFGYQNGGSSLNLTGSPDYPARVRVVGDPGSGCSDDRLKQFNTAAFEGPFVGSVGLESGNGYLRGCFQSSLDLAIARTIQLGGGRSVQLRLDVFNAFNEAAITNRNATLNLTTPNDPVTARNLPFDADGALIDARSRPRGAGFGVATGYQTPRTMQAQIRFQF
jgi:hypothetical protein